MALRQTLPESTNEEHVLFIPIGRYLQKLSLPSLSSSTEDTCAKKKGTSAVFKGQSGSAILFACV
jgi:hypothetical protein